LETLNKREINHGRITRTAPARRSGLNQSKCTNSAEVTNNSKRHGTKGELILGIICKTRVQKLCFIMRQNNVTKNKIMRQNKWSLLERDKHRKYSIMSHL